MGLRRSCSVGMVFIPDDDAVEAKCVQILEEVAKAENFKVCFGHACWGATLGWPAALGVCGPHCAKCRAGGCKPAAGAEETRRSTAGGSHPGSKCVGRGKRSPPCGTA